MFDRIKNTLERSNRDPQVACASISRSVFEKPIVYSVVFFCTFGISLNSKLSPISNFVTEYPAN